MRCCHKDEQSALFITPQQRAGLDTRLAAQARVIVESLKWVSFSIKFQFPAMELFTATMALVISPCLAIVSACLHLSPEALADAFPYVERRYELLTEDARSDRK